MSLFREIQNIKAQIVDTERLIEMVVDHPIMYEGFVQRLSSLRNDLESLPKESYEPKVQLLFSGNAVIGSQGIKSSFVSKTVAPFQEMIKTQFALVRFGRVGKRGKAKSFTNTDLYLTALPTGSFGIELSQLETTDIFASLDISTSMKQVIELINNVTTDEDTFEDTIEKTPKRNLSNLKKFLQELVNENSVLKLECGEVGLEISKEKVVEAYQRVSSTIDDENEMFITGIFRGLLLDSGKFEFQDEDGLKHSGFISEDIDEEQLVEYDKLFLNKTCVIHLRIHKTKFITGNEKTDYELLEVR